MTTLPTTPNPLLSELLNYLESETLDLERRYFEVLDTLEKDILPRVVRLFSIINADTTKNC